MNKDKLISVIMPIYNETKEEIENSINSILNQTYTNIEFIIINDNPNRKELGNILSSFNDNRIKVLTNKKNNGLVYSLNRALNEAKGEYIARMDADDISDVNRLEKQLNFLINKDVDLIGSYINKIYSQSGRIEKIEYPTSYKKIKKVLKISQCIPHPTWLVKKSVYMKLNGYRNINYCEDYDFLLRAINTNIKFANIPEYLLNYHIRKDGISEKNKNTQFLTKYYLIKNKNNIEDINEKNINQFINNEKDKYQLYIEAINQIKSNKINIMKIVNLLLNKYFYIKLYFYVAEKILFLTV